MIKISVVGLPNTVVKPVAVMVEIKSAHIALTTVFGCVIDVSFTDVAKHVQISTVLGHIFC